ncbi:MAG: hypothetical protein QM811_12055 [Pirellulales bacterium]
MEWLEWIFSSLKWLIFDFPKPDNLSKLANAIGPFWMYAVLFGIIFSETGLLVGFFLPGDSLLFTAGLLCALPDMPISIFVLVPLLCVAAIVGDALNYGLGSRMGNRVYEKGNLWFIKHDHLMAAKAFYEKHGGKAIILVRASFLWCARSRRSWPASHGWTTNASRGSTSWAGSVGSVRCRSPGGSSATSWDKTSSC